MTTTLIRGNDTFKYVPLGSMPNDSTPAQEAFGVQAKQFQHLFTMLSA